MKEFFKKLQTIHHKLLTNESGQSLIEIMIALAIGVVLIGGSSIAIVAVLQSSQTSQIQQHATALSQEIIEKGQIYTTADWSNVYDLQKGSSTVYFFSASSTKLFHIEGEEGVVSGDIQDGLIGHWKLDEATGTTAYDFSGNGNHGILENNPTRATSTCKVGFCINFDGNSDYVDCGSNEILDIGTSDFTLSVWVKTSATSTAGIIGRTFSGSGNRYSLFISSSEGLGALIAQTGHIGVWEGTTYLDGDWHLVTATYDRDGFLSLYIDRGFIDNVNISSLSGLDLQPQDNFHIGIYPDGSHNPANFFEGSIDDARIYNRVLSADEVEHLYNSTMFNRYFYIENVCRTNDANYELAGVAPCDGGEVDDPSTQRITGVVEWSGKDKTANFSLIRYLTRWRNEVFHQTDWSGGSGQEGPVEKSSDQYASSTDIDFSSSGEIKIEFD